MHRKTTANPLPEPPPELQRMSSRLVEQIRATLPADGFLPFADFMERALYEAGLGYYSAGLHKLGATGDFVTAPELGTLFARCLALQCLEIGERLRAGPGHTGDWDLLEIGAGSGALAAGLLEALAEQPEAAPRRYRILERSADLRAVQQGRLESLDLPPAITVEWLDQPPVTSWQGVVLANEVLDALPAERFCWDGERLLQVGVAWAPDGATWSTRPAPPALDETLRRTLGDRLEGLPAGYTSEFRPRLDAWLAAVTGCLEHGAALFVDYGYPRDEYYHPQRTDGTLVCHYRHRAHGNPFWWPGLQDLSAFVDFTALAEAGAACGLELAGYDSQASFLLSLGLERMVEGVAGDFASLPDRKRLPLAREIRELTLPGAMGEKFQVMALTRGMDPGNTERPLAGFRGPGLAHRL